MDQKKRIIIAVALLAVALIIIGAAAALIYSGDSYISKVERGYRYLDEGDFNKAMLCFRSAIEMDDTREEGYYGLYLTYVRAGQPENALATLRVGVARARSQMLIDLLTQVEGGTTEEETSQNTTDQEELVTDPADKTVAAVLNTDLLSFLASASYGDYCARYQNTAGTYSNGQYTWHLDAVGATLYFYDTASQRIIDTARGVPYSQYQPNEIRLDNVTSLFGINQLNFNTLRTLQGILDVGQKDNIITFKYGGCEITIKCGADGIINAGDENSIIPSGGTDIGGQQHVFSAAIMDATNNAPIMGATVKAYEGYNTFGEYKEGTTDGGGRVKIDLDKSGMYTIEISKAGYITETFEVQILSGMVQTEKTFHISPELSGNAIRFVLTWGTAPRDLDSYLRGYGSDGTYTAVFFGEMTQRNAAGQVIAELDVDDTSSYGPETTTLYDIRGNYEFFVDDFTDSGLTGASGATVKIYMGSALYATVVVPSDVTDMWHVCTITNGTITVTNRGM